MIFARSLLFIATPSVALAVGCSHADVNAPAKSAEPATSPAPTGLLADAQRELGALPAPEPARPELLELGHRLFFETGASADGRVGCASCHLPDRWGADGRAVPFGVFGRRNPRNAPTVFNAGGQSAQHWRGDRESLEQQASRALLGPASFGNASEADATARLKQLPEAPDFARAFPDAADPVSIENWGLAIAAYERSLATPAPFDAWLGGGGKALAPGAQRGLSVFMEAGCSECHDGALLGGHGFAKFGRERDYWPLTHSEPVDAGRFDVTHDEGDRYVFKIAALRNVAKTAPYFHDGSVATLPEAVDIMAQTQLGRQLAPEDRDALVAFLETLTGPVPAEFAAPPGMSATLVPAPAEPVPTAPAHPTPGATSK